LTIPNPTLLYVGVLPVADTLIVNGHTTTSDALWAGVPVITLQGRHFASRVSSSLLSATGMTSLIVHNTDDYRNLAVRLAEKPEELKDLCQKSIQNAHCIITITVKSFIIQNSVPSSGKIKSVLKSNKSQKIKSELSGVVVFVDEIEKTLHYDQIY